MSTKDLYIYFQERFPLPGVLLISASFALLAIGSNGDTVPQWALKFTLLIGLFVFLLLRQRVTDEFKDSEHDNINYPDRPYQRGLISKKSLLIIFSISLTVELLFAYCLSGFEKFGWYLLVFAYSLLMAKEFFSSKWLAKHFTTYFLIHEVIFLLLAIWIVKFMNLNFNSYTAAWVIAFICIMMCIEIVRKFEFRYNPKGEIVKDTYTSVWGETISRSLIELLILFSGILLSYSKHSLIPAVIASIASLTLNILQPKNKRLQVTVGIYIVLTGVIGSIL